MQLVDSGGTAPNGRWITHEFAGSENSISASSMSRVTGPWCIPPSTPVVEAAETRRLTADEEVDPFRRMNFLKHRAERLRQLVVDDYCPPDTVDAIQRLLEESTRLRNYLVQVFSKLAVSVARPYANLEFRLDELMSESHVTLLRCVEIFDADRGYRFSTYATNAIRHNLNRYVSRQRRLRQNTREYVATDGLTAESMENPRRREREYSARMSGSFPMAAGTRPSRADDSQVTLRPDGRSQQSDPAIVGRSTGVIARANSAAGNPRHSETAGTWPVVPAWSLKPE